MLSNPAFVVEGGQSGAVADWPGIHNILRRRDAADS
jgi:hypothetical protein